MDVKKLIGYPAWAVAFLGRFVLMAVGVTLTAFSLVSDGEKRTPAMWSWLIGNSADAPTFTPPKWSYGYVPLMVALSWYGYFNWHPLVAIYFIFNTIGSALIVSSATKWSKFWWMAIRNPVEGLDSILTQPIPERMPNPDETVRNGYTMKAVRKMQSGIFWEYWSLSRIESGRWKGRYWEFRIGWKFVDGNKDFVPTIQFGPKK